MYGYLGVIVDRVQVDRLVEFLLWWDCARVILVVYELDGERPVSLKFTNLSDFVLQFGERDVRAYVGDHYLSFGGTKEERRSC